MFRTLNKNNKTNTLYIQGARSDDPNSDIASMTFQNYDDDSKITYDMASVAMRDHVGGLTDGVADLLFKTSGSNGLLTEKMRIAHNGFVGIGTNVPSQQLHVIGNVVVSDGMVADSITANTLVVNELDISHCNLYVDSLEVSQATVLNTLTVSGAMDVNSNLIINAPVTVNAPMRIAGGFTVFNI